MNLKEKRMKELLVELKKDYNVLAVKAEFEAEGSRTDELVKLNEGNISAKFINQYLIIQIEF